MNWFELRVFNRPEGLVFHMRDENRSDVFDNTCPYLIDILKSRLNDILKDL